MPSLRCRRGAGAQGLAITELDDGAVGGGEGAVVADGVVVLPRLPHQAAGVAAACGHIVDLGLAGAGETQMVRGAAGLVAATAARQQHEDELAFLP